MFRPARSFVRHARYSCSLATSPRRKLVSKLLKHSKAVWLDWFWLRGFLAVAASSFGGADPSACIALSSAAGDALGLLASALFDQGSAFLLALPPSLFRIILRFTPPT
uniref:Uncharacterized protein n=1 Tax=Chloropicon laureae TaxID=464258 RepID=A0A7S2YUD3_9CHLO